MGENPMLSLGNIDKANLVLEEFKRLFKHSPDDGYFRSKYENRVAFLMATFLEYWFKQGKETEAMECYDRSVLADKFPVNYETGDALLKILLKYGKKTHAWALYHEILDQSCLSSFTVKMMVDECFEMGQCRKAIETEMLPVLFSRGLISGCCSTALSETYNKAIAKNRFLSDPYMITRCCENGMLSVAESLVADMGGVGFGFMDNTIFKTMIDAYLKAGRIEDAIKTSNQMIDATLKDLPNLF